MVLADGIKTISYIDSMALQLNMPAAPSGGINTINCIEWTALPQ